MEGSASPVREVKGPCTPQAGFAGVLAVLGGQETSCARIVWGTERMAVAGGGSIVLTRHLRRPQTPSQSHCLFHGVPCVSDI